jgi:hypothetical protein
VILTMMDQSQSTVRAVIQVRSTLGIEIRRRIRNEAQAHKRLTLSHQNKRLNMEAHMTPTPKIKRLKTEKKKKKKKWTIF